MNPYVMMRMGGDLGILLGFPGDYKASTDD